MAKFASIAAKIIFYAIIIVYLALLAHIVLFKYVSPVDVFSADRTWSRNVNLTPFHTIGLYLQGGNSWISAMNVLGNIAIFVPLGAYLPMFTRHKGFFRTTAVVAAISACIEVVQFGLGIGAGDIDDIILNTIGGMVGVAIYKIAYSIWKEERKARVAVTLLFCCMAAGFFVYLAVLTASGLKIRLF